MNDVFIVRCFIVLAGQAFFFLTTKRNKNCRLKIFLFKLVVRFGLSIPKNLLGRFKVERRNSTLALQTAKTNQD